MTIQNGTVESKAQALKLKAIYAKLDREVELRKLLPRQAFSLGLMAEFLTFSPDGDYAEILVKLIQGEY